MKLGVTMSPTNYSIRPNDLARACEERGFESLWFPEHSHIPTSRRSPVPTGRTLPKEYAHTHDLFIALTLAAAATKTIKLGSGICLAVQRDPIMLAKQVASFDQLSNGRFLFGIGGGWNAEEMENHGVPFHRRWKVLREKIEAMKAIWTQDEAEYHGEFVDFDPIWAYPKPSSSPIHRFLWARSSLLGCIVLSLIVMVGFRWERQCKTCREPYTLSAVRPSKLVGG